MAGYNVDYSQLFANFLGYGGGRYPRFSFGAATEDEDTEKIQIIILFIYTI